MVLLLLTGLQALHLLPDSKHLLYASFLAAATPSASFVTQLSQLHDRQPEYAGAINVMTSLCCLLTMPLMTMLFDALI